MFGSPNRPGEARPRVRTAVATLVGAELLALVASWPYAVAGDLAPGETGAFRWANGLPAGLGWVLEPAMHLATPIGLVLLVAVALVRRRSAVAIAAVAAWTVTRWASRTVKTVLERGRPPEFVADVVLRQHLPSSAGYTSTHTACATALAVVGAWAWPRWWAAFAAFAVLAGVARMFVGVHLPLDVVGGWAIGVLISVPVCAAAGAVARRGALADGRTPALADATPGDENDGDDGS